MIKNRSLNSGRSLFIFYLLLISVIGFLSLVWLLSSWNDLTYKFSEYNQWLQRASIIGYIGNLIFSVSCLFLALSIILLKEKTISISEWFQKIIDRKPVLNSIIVLCILFLLLAFQVLLQMAGLTNALDRSFLFLIRPLLFWVILVSATILAVILKITGTIQRIAQPDVIKALLIAASLLILLVLINLSDYGFMKSSSLTGNFRTTGYPIVDYQVFLSLIGVITCYLVVNWLVQTINIKRKISPVLIDLFIGVSLFVIAYSLSNTTPVVPNAFIDLPRPPNYTYTPNLDAEIYDRTAQNLLVTGRMQTYIDETGTRELGRRPILAVYLAGLHWIKGNLYEDILSTQLLFFAIIPVLIFLITKTLHNRISAVLTAVLVIIRHQNGLKLAGEVWGGTNLHMLMSDFPALIVLLVFLWLFMIWYKDPKDKSLFPVMIGGILGLGLLIRQELIILLPAVIAAAIIGFRKKFVFITKQALLITLGVVIVISPWIGRNWIKTGNLYLDKPGDLNRILRTLKLSVDYPKETLPTLPYEIEDEILISSAEGEGQSYPENQTQPGSLGLTLNHYASAIPQLFLYLPNNSIFLEMDYLRSFANGKLNKDYGGWLYSPYQYAKSLSYWWWDSWDGKIDQKSWIYLTITIVFISLGFVRVWKKEGWLSFIPVFAIFGMISVYALIRASGGRYLQLVDWITSMFLSIGLVEVILSYPDQQELEDSAVDDQFGTMAFPRNVRTDSGNTVWIILITIIFILGFSPVIIEYFVPNYFTVDQMETQLTSMFEDDQNPISSLERDYLTSFLDQGGDVIHGKALYPRYFPAEAQLMTRNQTLFPSSLTFTISGTELNYVILSLSESPNSFPHGSEVITFGCRDISYQPDARFPCLGCNTEGFDALAVIIYNSMDQVEHILWREGYPNNYPGCPLSWVEY